MDKILHLHLKGEYFDDIFVGKKLFEYRIVNDYWTKRIHKYDFTHIKLSRGFPKRDDMNKNMFRPWKGYEMKTITHPHFGHNPVQVYAIIVN